MIFVLVYVGCSYYQPTANQTGEMHRMFLLSFDAGLKQYEFERDKHNWERKSNLFCIYLWLIQVNINQFLRQDEFFSCCSYTRLKSNIV